MTNIHAERAMRENLRMAFDANLDTDEMVIVMNRTRSRTVRRPWWAPWRKDTEETYSDPSTPIKLHGERLGDGTFSWGLPPGHLLGWVWDGTYTVDGFSLYLNGTLFAEGGDLLGTPDIDSLIVPSVTIRVEL